MSNVGAEKTWLKWICTNERKPSREDAERGSKVIAVYKAYGEEARTEAEYYDLVREFPSLHPDWAVIPEPLPGTYGDIPDGAMMMEWIPAVDKLPTVDDASNRSESGYVIIRCRHSWQGIWLYESKFVRLYELKFWGAKEYAWLPFPKPPKGVE